MAGHWPRLLRPYWVPRVPRYQGYQGYQGYQESGSGMGVSGSLPDLPDSTQSPRFRTNRGRGRGSVPVPGQIGDRPRGGYGPRLSESACAEQSHFNNSR